MERNRRNHGQLITQLGWSSAQRFGDPQVFVSCRYCTRLWSRLRVHVHSAFLWRTSDSWLWWTGLKCVPQNTEMVPTGAFINLLSWPWLPFILALMPPSNICTVQSPCKVRLKWGVISLEVSSNSFVNGYPYLLPFEVVVSRCRTVSLVCNWLHLHPFVWNGKIWLHLASICFMTSFVGVTMVGFQCTQHCNTITVTSWHFWSPLSHLKGCVCVATYWSP